jgi:hypothetical protein
MPRGRCRIEFARRILATVFADKVGHARQLVVTPNNTAYVNTWSGVYYNNDTPPPGGFLIAFEDTKGTGHADVTVRFGPTFAEGAHGGTGIWLYKNWLYAEINDQIVRYELKNGKVAPTGKPEAILSGMPITGDHPMHPFAIDAEGNLFVSMGSATNACEVQNRMPHSQGNDPCTELKTRAGIWRYNANKTDQVFLPKERYGTGIRNGEGFDFDTSGRLYVTQHGRDQLHENWPELYTAEQGFELPAEEVMILKESANYGWPICYFDAAQKKRVLAPECGGDGGKESGDCEKLTHQSRRFPPTGRRTISKSTMAYSSRRDTKAAPLSPSMVRGTARRGHKADTTSFSSRYPTARLPAITSFLPTASRASTRSPAEPYTVRQVWRWDEMARFISLMTRLVGSGA